MCPSHFVSMAVRKIIKSSLITTPSIWLHWEEQKVGGVGLPCGHIGRSIMWGWGCHVATLGGAKGGGGAATPSTWPHWEEQKVGVGLPRLLHGHIGRSNGGGGAATPSTWPHWEEQKVGVGLPRLLHGHIGRSKRWGWGCHAFYMATLGGAKGGGGAATPSTWPHWEEQKVGVGLTCLLHGHIGRSKRWGWGCHAFYMATLGGAKGGGGAATPSTWPHWEEQKVGVGLPRLLHGHIGRSNGGGGAATPSTWPHWEEQKVGVGLPRLLHGHIGRSKR